MYAAWVKITSEGDLVLYASLIFKYPVTDYLRTRWYGTAFPEEKQPFRVKLVELATVVRQYFKVLK